MEEYDEKDYALARILCDSVMIRDANGFRTLRLTYIECSDILKKRYNIDVHHHTQLKDHLFNVDEMCHTLGLPLISAIVIYSSKNPNETTALQVGEGFYSMACIFKPEYKSMEPVDAWKTELNLVRECKDWSKLDNYLKEHF